MSIYGGYSYERERQSRLTLWEQAPKQCPHCQAPINERFEEYGSSKPRYHCGADKCRKAQSRINIAERKRQARADARVRVLAYCEQHLGGEERQAVMNMTDMLMQYSSEEGHQIAEQVVKVIEAKRCKHDRIKLLEENALLWQRRAQASECQLKERIRELEEELELFTTLHNAIHGIVVSQLQKQPDPPEQPTKSVSEDADYARTLDVLKQTGPYQAISLMIREELEAEASGETFQSGNREE